MPEPLNCHVLLQAEGVAVVLDLTAGRLPVVAYWGADVGEISPDDVAALVRAGEPPAGPNLPDEPLRVALLPEHHTGWVGRPGLSGSRDGRDWSPRFTTTALRVDGEPADANPVDSGRPVLLSLGAASVELDAVDPVAGLALTLTVELLAGGVLRTNASLTNTGAEPYQLDELVLALPVPATASELLEFAGRWAKERVPQRRAFTVGTHLREGRRGRTGADAATVLHAGVPGFGFARGDVWGVHVGWSGNHVHYAERANTGHRLLGGGELLLPGELRLAGGESYTSPWLYGSFGDGLDAVARRFHRYLRARPGHPSIERPVTLNVWEAVYFDHSLPVLLDLAEKAAAVGVERFVLDDGWFGSRRDDTSGLGDWVVSDAAWPDGLHPLVTRVRELGMQFGLWFEPEMVNPDSDLARAHPEWILATGGRLPIESRHQQVLNLADPDCYAHVKKAMSAVIDDYAIDYLKWDHNRDLIDAGSQPHGRPAVHAQTLAAYRLMAELKASHPGLEIESCSSGGARVDLGVMQHADRVWVSDCIDPHERQSMMRWTTQLLPPELLGSHIASATSHTTGRSHSLAFRAGTALFGHLGIEWDLRQASDADLAALTEWIGFHKGLRPLLFGGDLVRIDTSDAAIVAGGVVAPDRSRALFSVAALDSLDVVLPGRLPLPGLDADRRYRVAPVLLGGGGGGVLPPPWWGLRGDLHELLDDVSHGRPPQIDTADGRLGVVLPGAVLATAGVMMAPSQPDQVVLYLVEAVD